MNEWTKEDALNEYQVLRWGEGYFNINSEGELIVCPDGLKPNKHYSIAKIVEEMYGKNISFPCVIRFHDVLRSQIRKMNHLFSTLMTEAQYSGKYYGVYPTKVNQLREVVEEVVDAGKDFNYGLEAGSKAEILVALTYNQNKSSLTILNGYKDFEFMELAVLGTKLGHSLVVVIEKLSEIDLLIKAIKKHNAEPIIGVRAKLTSRSSGKWSSSSGEKAKFGLSISEILELIEILKGHELLVQLNLFHFHVGSQIPDIRTIKDCLIEGARTYCELSKLGVPLKFFDAGGGAGVNYDGTRSNSTSSTNYSLKDYIADIVYITRDICNASNVCHPHLVNEAGRVITAHHSCVVTNVFGSIKMLKPKRMTPPPVGPNDTSNKSSLENYAIVANMLELHKELNHANYQDVFNDAQVKKDEAISAFKLGHLSLKARAQVEELYYSICYKIVNMTENDRYTPIEIKKLKSELCEKYLCNFSVFQSIPDAWAIDQVLPIVPLKRLKERPEVICTLSDITCDSDGAIERFTGPDGLSKTIKLHKLEGGEDYPIGIFLTGAYQDVMGDMHNLFGRLNEIHVFMDEEDESLGFYIEETVTGQKCSEVLSIMQYNPKEMCKKIKSRLDRLVKDGDIRPRVGVQLSELFEKNMYSYTYLKTTNLRPQSLKSEREQ